MVRLATAVLCALALCGLTPSFGQDPSRALFPRLRFPLTEYGALSNDALEAGDFDADGALDLVVAAGDGIDLLSSVAPGLFDPAVHIDMGSAISALAVGDFDGDGIDDLAVGSSELMSVYVLRGQVAVGLGSATSVPTAGLVQALDVADVDLDGALDLVATCSNPNRGSLLWNDGAGNFSQRTDLTGVVPLRCAAIGDWNLDGLPDLAFGSASTVITVWIGQGQRMFAAGLQLATPWWSRRLLLGDFDEDGISDLAVVPSSGVYLRSFAGDGVGGFSAPIDHQLPNFSYTTDGAMADHDGDGHLDLLLANVNSPGHPFLMLGDGARDFSVGPIVAGTGTYSLLWRDLDRDGDRDLALAAGFAVECSFDHGQGLQPPLQTSVSYGAALDVDAGDLDGDGMAELLVSTWTDGPHGSSGSIATFRNLGPGGFGAPSYSWYSLPPAIACTLADLNHDGDLDRIVNLFDGRIEVALGAADISFSAPATAVVAGGSLGFELEDLNGDGELDLVSVSRTARRISVLLGDGLGNFLSGTNYTLAVEPHSFALVDVDHDGDDDIVLGTVELHLAVVQNDGAAQFGAVVLHALDRRLIVRAALDWNGDGLIDVLATEFANSVWSSSPELFVIPGVTGGGFATPQLLVNESVARLAVADLDGDGDQDLITTNGSEVVARFFDPQGALVDTLRFGASSQPIAFALADIDDDGRIDVATTDGNLSSASVLLHDRRLPGFYCQPTASAAGCVAELRVDGCAQASGTAPFIVRASGVEPNVVGGLLYGFGRASTPFHGVTLCVTEPLRRTGIQPTGGSTPSSCSGSLALDFNQHLRSGVDPALTIGVEACAQLWFLDPAPGQRLATSNAVEFTVLP